MSHGNLLWIMLNQQGREQSRNCGCNERRSRDAECESHGDIVRVICAEIARGEKPAANQLRSQEADIN